MSSKESSASDSAEANVQRPRRMGLSHVSEIRLREKLRRRCPSAPWVDAQFKTFTDRDERGQPIVYRYHDASVFPPGGTDTSMVRCPRCGVFTPPNAFENGVCLDHAEPAEVLEAHLGWGRSPSAVAIAALQFRNLRMIDKPLPPETTAALRSEIRREQKKRKRR